VFLDAGDYKNLVFRFSQTLSKLTSNKPIPRIFKIKTKIKKIKVTLPD